jgi:hypothetical protein
MSKPKNRKPADLAKVAQVIAPSIVKDIQSIREKSLALELHERRQRELARRPNETVCEHARRLAGLEEQTRANEAATREQAFLDSLFPDRSQYVNHGDHTYTICGHRWGYPYSPSSVSYLYLIGSHPDNLYRNTIIPSSVFATNLVEFGAALIHIDKHVEFIDKTYPNTLWGRFRLWLNYRFL